MKLGVKIQKWLGWDKLNRATKTAIGAIMVLTVAFMVFCETKKVGFHEDEVYTITSSVSSVWRGIMTTAEDGVPIVKDRETYQSYVDSQGFNPALVYSNQASDVHPPLYYLLFHFVALILPNFTLQVAFIINLVFFLMLELAVVKIFVLLGKEKAILPTLIFLGFSVLGINMVTFQRMYTVLAFFVMLILYYNLKIWKQKFEIEKHDAMGLGFAVVLSFLTQYFGVIYTVIIFTIMCVMMVKAKNYDSLKKYVGVHIGAGVVGVVIYPASIAHIFFSYRGVGAMATEVAEASFGGKIAGFLQVVRNNIYLPLILVAAILIWWMLWKRNVEKDLLIIPALVYILIVILIAPYTEIRYLMPVMAIIVMCLMAVLTEFSGEKLGMVIAVIGVLLGAMIYKPSFLYPERQAALDVAEANMEKTLVFVTGDNFTFIKHLSEYLTYDKTVIVKEAYDEIRKIEGVEGEFILRIENGLDKGFIVNVFEGWGYEKKAELDLGDGYGYVMEKINENN